MKKKLILLLILFLFPFVTNASSNGYVIDKYDVEITVNENNTFDVIEKIDTTFEVPKHGIYRTLPLTNKVVRLDGTVNKNRVAITNIELSDPYSREMENGNLKLQIGDENRTITGKKSYTIKYNYNIGKDPLKDKDELYYNIIGDGWDTTIKNVTFKITMPKDFDIEKLGFSYGSYGETNLEGFEYDTDGRVITGTLSNGLNAYEAFTVRLELPEGYFVGAGNKFSIFNIITICIALTASVVMYLLWNKHGKDELVVDSVEFYPPDNIDPLEIAYAYKKMVTSNDVISLLIVLANKGYLKIQDDPKHKKDFIITKLKEYDGDNEIEKVFFDTLFTEKLGSKNPTLITVEARVKEKLEHGKKVNVVTKDDLYDNFYETINYIVSKTNTKEHRNKYFDKKADKLKGVSILIVLAVYLLTLLPPILTYEYYELGMVGLIFLFISMVVFFSSFSNLKKLYLVTIISGIIYFGIFFGLLYPLLSFDNVYLIVYIINMASLFIMCICWNSLDKRTPYGVNMFGRVKGFKNFLETAEKERLESLVKEHPTYFYDILPYTYVLGISSKWIKKFESITIEAPKWYDGYNDFDTITFSRFMDNTIASASSSMQASPSSSSGSGGGFSGGGSGGGGGGSW